MQLNWIDTSVFTLYLLLVLFLGIIISRRKHGGRTANDYFLAGKGLPWWAIGSSIIAANISAEEIIGSTGIGYSTGIAVASYELMAAITLVIVAKYILPVLLKKNIQTLPEFLEIRFDWRVRTSLAVFWILLYIFINLTSILYLGALACQSFLGIPFAYCIIGLVLIAGFLNLYGGLMAVAWTDVLQVIVLIGGGLLTCFLALNALGAGEGVIAGFRNLLNTHPEKFNLILEPSHPAYKDLPGISVLIGGMWIANLFYFGCNQFITQHALASKNIRQAQYGLVFAGFLKLLLPLIVVLPGVAAYALNAKGLSKPDEAYPWLLSNYVPEGLKGLAFSGLIAAIISSLCAIVNAISTIFTLDIYKKLIDKEAQDRKIVRVGRIVSLTAFIIAALIAPSLDSLHHIFHFIQEFTGFVSPGILAIFLLGLFWKKANTISALWAALLTVPLSVFFKYFVPQLPFLDRMGVVFIILVAVVAVITLAGRQGEHPKAIQISRDMFRTGPAFAVGSIIISVILAGIYIIFW